MHNVEILYTITIIFIASWNIVCFTEIFMCKGIYLMWKSEFVGCDTAITLCITT